MAAGGLVRVERTGDRLCLVPAVDRNGPYFTFPDRRGLGSARLSFPEAVHARIFPAGTAERVLGAWSRDEPLPAWLPFEDPSRPSPDRRRGGAVVLSGDRMLLIRYPPAEGRRYFIPGGGVEPGEAPAAAAVRELREETGLTGRVVRQLATVYNRGREEHYQLVDVGRPRRPARALDLAPGQALEWVDVAALPDTPVWPKRLAWRITYWAEHGWPDPPAVLADSSGDLDSPCAW